MATITRKQFLTGAAVASLAVGQQAEAFIAPRGVKRPRAITMWDFSWLERRWPGAGFEDWDEALDGLVERGYDAVRIDAYPHLVSAGPEKDWLLKPTWNTQDWGAPGLVQVRVLPALHRFIAKCAQRGVKVGLSTWFRQDETEERMKITDGIKLAAIWRVVLKSIEAADLLDHILYVDLCNEWPNTHSAPFVLPALDWGHWYEPRSLGWMKPAIASLRGDFPDLPLLFSFDNNEPDHYTQTDISFLDGIEQHLWMAGENGDEFYKSVGYDYQRFSEDGYLNMQRHAASVYSTRKDYWRKLLTDKIALVAAAARRARQPLMTTEAWGPIDYKDWPMLPWDWVKELCALGTLTASATGQWAAITTSNFCAPQFKGMWRDIAWHRHLTDAIKMGPVHETVRGSRLWARI